MTDKIKSLLQEVEAYTIQSKEHIEEFRLKYVSRKGLISELFNDLKSVAVEQKKLVGQELNKLKEAAQHKIDQALETISDQPEESEQNFDYTLPVVPNTLGSRHPLTIVKDRINEIFARMGFNVEEGPEIEDDWHNFTALNFPPNHPAREMQDTFFIKRNPDIALRTHTSSVQVRLMERQKPPIRSLMPGRVFRNEAVSARAHCVFHQVEGLYINEKVSFKDLKDTLYHFVKEMFGKDVKMRFRPSYFPFTEPSAEMDITCLICKGQGCNICKQSGWVEIGGSGMVDPNVLINCNIDPQKYSGFAFGMGIERITMLKYQIKDLRLFTENDVRFLKQFSSLD